MSKIKPWIVLLLVFFTGAVVGGGATAIHFYVKVSRLLPQPGPPPLEHLVDHLDRILDLDGEQEALALDILTRHRPSAEAVLGQCKADMDEVLESIRDELLGHLDPGQQDKLNDFVERIQSGDWGDHGPPRP